MSQKKKYECAALEKDEKMKNELQEQQANFDREMEALKEKLREHQENNRPKIGDAIQVAGAMTGVGATIGGVAGGGCDRGAARIRAYWVGV